MKFVNVLIIAMMLLSCTALAGEKISDTQNALPNLSTLSVLAGTLDENSPTYNRIFGGAVSLDCNSVVSDSGNDGMYFALFCIEVNSSDPIEMVVDPGSTDLDDTIMTIYCDPFDPGAPEVNVISYDDDGGEGFLSAFTIEDNITLTPGNTYYLVLSTFSAGDMGDFAINTSDNVSECGTVPTEASSWDSLKASYR